MLRDRLQALWVRNTRNRIVIMVSTAVLAVLLLCGCLNLLGAIGGGVVDSLLTSGTPVRPTIPSGTQVANINPTFPLPQPTVYSYPPGTGGTPLPASSTPPPTPTPSPTSAVTATPPDGGGGRIRYQLSPDPSGRAFVAGAQNTITLSGPPGTQVSVSVFFTNSPCLPSMVPGDPVTLDGTGQGSFNCTIPAQLKGSQVTMAISTPFDQRQYVIPVN
jgi:hypothetical protein